MSERISLLVTHFCYIGRIHVVKIVCHVLLKVIVSSECRKICSSKPHSQSSLLSNISKIIDHQFLIDFSDNFIKLISKKGDIFNVSLKCPFDWCNWKMMLGFRIKLSGQKESLQKNLVKKSWERLKEPIRCTMYREKKVCVKQNSSWRMINDFFDFASTQKK